MDTIELAPAVAGNAATAVTHAAQKATTKGEARGRNTVKVSR
jgi:hypothetical protein